MSLSFARIASLILGSSLLSILVSFPTFGTLKQRYVFLNLLISQRFSVKRLGQCFAKESMNGTEPSSNVDKSFCGSFVILLTVKRSFDEHSLVCELFVKMPDRKVSSENPTVYPLRFSYMFLFPVFFLRTVESRKLCWCMHTFES